MSILYFEIICWSYNSMSEKATINICRNLNQTLKLFENSQWLPKLHSTSFFHKDFLHLQV